MDILKGTKPISPYQFAVFRVVFGLYLTVHFGQLFPYAGELFSGEGVIGDARLNPLYGLFPNLLAIWDDPIIARLFLATAVVLSFAFTAGVFRRSTAILLWFLWACLFHRNNLISNPGIPYVGLLLIAPGSIPRSLLRTFNFEIWKLKCLGACPEDLYSCARSCRPEID